MHPLPEICNFGVSHGPLPAPGVLRIDPSWWLELGSEQPARVCKSAGWGSLILYFINYIHTRLDSS